MKFKCLHPSFEMLQECRKWKDSEAHLRIVLIHREVLELSVTSCYISHVL